MSLKSALAAFLAGLKAPIPSGENGIEGTAANPIAEARIELKGDDAVTHATLGTPHLADHSGKFKTDVKAMIPVETPKYQDPAPLSFDVDGSELMRFLDALDVHTVDNIDEIEGKTVPVTWTGGTPVVDWHRLASAGGEA
jgi:hypothetical protein